MFKNLLTLAAVALVAVSANALTLPLDDLATGWDTTYDTETHTITYAGAWTGRGWWLDSVDYSDYDNVVVTVEPTTITAQLCVEYVDADTPSTSGLCELGATKISVELNPTLKKAVKQIYLQCGALTDAPTITLVSAEVVASEGDKSILWEGEYTATGWNSGANIPNFKVAVGDVLHYYMTPGSADAQVIVKGSDWNNLLGTAKISNKDIIDGIVEVVVNEQMLANCGDKIFLQGDGGITCTKVQCVGKVEDNSEYTVTVGTRMMPVDIFTTLPEDAKYLTLQLNKVPEWLQVCDNSWNVLVDNSTAAVVESGDAVAMSFPLTAEIIATINTSKQMVINGDASIVFYGATITDGTAAAEPIFTVGSVDNVTPWWTAWSPTTVLTGNGTIEYNFVNYSDAVNNWDNWVAVLVNGDFNPVQEGYGAENELVVLRADAYGWGALYGSTALENDYDWDAFKNDMNGAKVTLKFTRDGQVVEMLATTETVEGKTYTYTATISGVTSESIGAFLTVEGGHLDVYDIAVSGVSSAIDMVQESAPARYYNINGMEVSGSNLPAGLYIVKQGSKTSKVIVK